MDCPSDVRWVIPSCCEEAFVHLNWELPGIVRLQIILHCTQGVVDNIPKQYRYMEGSNTISLSATRCSSVSNW